MKTSKKVLAIVFIVLGVGIGLFFLLQLPATVWWLSAVFSAPHVSSDITGLIVLRMTLFMLQAVLSIALLWLGVRWIKKLRQEVEDDLDSIEI